MALPIKLRGAARLAPALIGAAGWLAAGSASAAGTAAIAAVTAGPTPFIANVSATTSGAAISSVSFGILPARGSYTRPILATYSATWLGQHGELSGGNVVIPAFGLYAGASNLIVLLFSFADGSTALRFAPFTTASYTDPCAHFATPNFTQFRSSQSDLGYDYFLLKDFCSSNSPAILDTDGNVRWVSTAGVKAIASTFYGNAVYLTDGGTGVLRNDLSGTVTKIGDYANIGITTTNHHNIDPGRNGLVVDVSTIYYAESTDLEINPATGAVLQQWNLDRIISQAMIAGGDDPSGFVFPTPSDWFHNNATTYNPADNTLIVSSRENFVIAVDYDVPADGLRKIHWILGDPTKHWYQYPSLRKYALTLGPNTLPPIGQHAVSIDRQGNLMLFDDGMNSTTQVPAGTLRGFSAARSYRIDTVARTATEVLNYTPNPMQFSPFCGSVYEPVSGSYLMDFATDNDETQLEMQGFGPTKFVFDSKYPEYGGCGAGWNALPIPPQPLQF